MQAINKLILTHERASRVLRDIIKLKNYEQGLKDKVEIEKSKPYTEMFMFRTPEWYEVELESTREGIKELENLYNELKSEINGK